ncbi:MAG TPA: ROK family protein [Gaiellaceae bacterium]|nr:ROK family protein [Gaiellaceae bacterium]
MAFPFVIGVDVGGTKILAGVLDREGQVLRRAEHETPSGSGDEVLAALAEAIESLLDGDVAALGLGIPSHLERGTGRILQATNLPLADLDLGAWARERFGLSVGVENDANAAALAEWRLGAGRGTSNVVVLTLGTGVGGGMVLDNRLYRGWAEIGHVVVQAGGPPCQGACHGRGHLEALASGTAADRVARELWGPDADSYALVERARAGDERARTALVEIGGFLGAAIGSLANLFDPDLVVVGGGFGEAAGELVLGPAQEAARREALSPADVTLRVVPAELGSEAGLVGAGLVAYDALDGEG